MTKHGLRNGIMVVLTGFFVFVVFSGMTLAAATIKMGIVGAHSGDLASYGIPTIKAAELVIKKVNARGGVLQGDCIK